MLKDAMGGYFRRLADAYASVGESPRVERNPEASDFIYSSEPDAHGYSAWQPVEKRTHHDLTSIAPDLGALHPSIHEYFNSWWFCALEGRFNGLGLSMLPVLPGLEVNTFVAEARAYKKAHGNTLTHVPLGVEFNGLQVLIDNATGAVVVEDLDRGTVEPIAADLETLVNGMSP